MPLSHLLPSGLAIRSATILVATMLVPSLALLTLAACSSDPPGLEVARQWRQTIHQYGFTPVYPLREDVRIGDVFVTMKDRNGEREAIPMKLTAADPGALDALLKSTYAERFVFNGDRPDASCSTPETKNCEAPLDETLTLERSTLSSGPTIRLMNLALPEVSVARVTTGDLSGGGTAYGAKIAAALGLSDQAVVEIHLVGLQEISVPLANAYNFIEANAPNLTRDVVTPDVIGAYIKQRNPALLASFCDGDLATVDAKGGFELTLANAVLYTRGIEYGYEGDNGFIGKLAASAAVSPPGMPSLGSTVAGDTSAATPEKADSLSASATLTRAQNVVSTLNSLAQNSSSPGAALSIGLSRTGLLSMNETYPRPMAVGFVSPITFRLSDLLPLWQGNRRQSGHGTASSPAADVPDATAGVCGKYHNGLETKISE